MTCGCGTTRRCWPPPANTGSGPAGSPYAVAPGRLHTKAGTPLQAFTPFFPGLARARLAGPGTERADALRRLETVRRLSRP